jgi:hypothetical protein
MRYEYYLTSLTYPFRSRRIIITWLIPIVDKIKILYIPNQVVYKRLELTWLVFPFL